MSSSGTTIGSASTLSSGTGGLEKGREFTPEFLAELKKAFQKNIIKVNKEKDNQQYTNIEGLEKTVLK